MSQTRHKSRVLPVAGKRISHFQPDWQQAELPWLVTSNCIKGGGGGDNPEVTVYSTYIHVKRAGYPRREMGLLLALLLVSRYAERTYGPRVGEEPCPIYSDQPA